MPAQPAKSAPTPASSPTDARTLEQHLLTRRQRRQSEQSEASPTDVVPMIPVPANPAAALRPVADAVTGSIPAVRAPRPIPLVSSGRTPHHPRATHKRKTARAWFSGAAMIAAAGLVTTLSLPAYAFHDQRTTDDNNPGASQSLTVKQVQALPVDRGAYTTIENVAAWDSTVGTTVPLTVQQLAQSLMADVASGKLSGSVPDHIPEIRNLAQGIAVPGCGVDYRVLQVIKVAVDNFNTVGVSDINRRCTGQIEGAGTQSAHYADGGGHAVDFDMLNGHGLSGGDAESLRLISVLDPLVPVGTHVGQQECRPSISLRNLVPFDDSCTHLHIDFGSAVGTSLRE
jgi:hypothetical protein